MRVERASISMAEMEAASRAAHLAVQRLDGGGGLGGVL